MGLKPFFQDIVLQCKDDKEDWRAFLHFIDKNNATWELRGYGNSPANAAQNAWERYQDDPTHWDIYGYIVSRRNKKI